MGCDSSRLKKKEEPEQQEYLEPKKVISPQSKNKQNVGQKQGPSRGKPPKYRTKIDSRVLAKYDVKALIGKGSFSDVLRVENKLTKQPYAVKILRLKNQHSKEVSQSELRALTRIRHPYVIQLMEVFESKECVYLVMELATGGELYERIKMKGHLTEKESIRVLQMVLEGVTYLHSKGITHRDLKPENLLFYHPGQDSKILITDFGFAKTTTNPEDNSLFTTWCGTPEYIAPELLCKKPYTNAVDIWAIGVITYVMISGHLPFAAETPSKLYQQIVRAKYSYSREVWKHTSDGAKDFIDKLLHVEPDQRPKAAEARKEAWVNSVAPLVSHKGHSYKYLSSQVSGKSGKTNGSYTSPVVRQKRLEEEMTSPPSQEKDKKMRMSRKEVEAGKFSTDVEMTDKKLECNSKLTGIENSVMFKDDAKRSDLNHQLKSELLAPVAKDKPESTVTSYQEEFPSAAATEDSNSFASRAEESPSIEADFVEQEFSAVSPRCDVNDKSVLESCAMNRFLDDTGVCDNWVDKNGSNLAKGNLLEMSLRDTGSDNWLSPRRGELDAMFAPLQKNKLKRYMQEKTSVMEKVGMWLEEQNGYSKDERLSNSHGDIDRINKANIQNDSRFDNSLVKYSTISAASSPIKKSNARNAIDSFRLQQYRWPENSGQFSLDSSEHVTNETTNEQIAHEMGLQNNEASQKMQRIRGDGYGQVAKDFNKDFVAGKPEVNATLGPMNGMSWKDFSRGIESYSLPRGEYNGNILLDKSNNLY